MLCKSVQKVEIQAIDLLLATIWGELRFGNVTPAQMCFYLLPFPTLLKKMFYNYLIFSMVALSLRIFLKYFVSHRETADCVSEYTSIAENYGNKIVSLSECGTVGLISEQWASGARWSWFMPWYDGTNEDGSPVVHADEAWWKDAMSQEFVVSREELPSME